MIKPHPELQYLDLLTDLMSAGHERPTRNDTTYSMFGRQLVFDLNDGFPLLTTKKVNFRSIVMELLWFLRGETNIKTLGCGIWDEWADETGDVGPVYGTQWRRWPAEPLKQYLPSGTYLKIPQGIDQIQNLIDGLRSDPYGRRHIVSAWNPAELPKMGLPPCHAFFQMYVEGDGRLSLMLHQRSADIFLGVPFNIASYALLLMIIGRCVGRAPGRLIMNLGDVHLYQGHMHAAAQQSLRPARPFPRITLADRENPWDYQLGDFTLVGYDPHPPLPAQVVA